MSKLVLPRDYTPEEMDRGEGMSFHPCEGYPRIGDAFKPPDYAKEVRFDPGTHVFVMYGGYNMSRPLRRIGDGNSYSAGMPYPRHWSFDPYEGFDLNDYYNEPVGVCEW